MNDKEKQAIVFKYLVSKMLKPIGVDYDYVMNNPTVWDFDWLGGEETEWQNYYTWTQAQHDKFYYEATEYIRGVLKYSKRQSEKIVINFLNQYGLNIENYEHK